MTGDDNFRDDLRPPADGLLALHAGPTLTSIRDMASDEQIPTKIREMLAYIEEHLFDPELNVNRVKAELGIHDNSVAIHFHSALGEAPHAYISRKRCEVANRLLAQTSLEIWRIADLLGYSGLQVFSRAFKRVTGLRPSVYREEKTRSREPGNRLLTGSATDEFRQRTLAGDLRDEEVEALILRLLELYPPRGRNRAVPGPVPISRPDDSEDDDFEDDDSEDE